MFITFELNAHHVQTECSLGIMLLYNAGLTIHLQTNSFVNLLDILSTSHIQLFQLLNFNHNHSDFGVVCSFNGFIEASYGMR